MAIRPNVAVGSKPDLNACLSDVRFTPKADMCERTLRCPLCANSGHSGIL